LRGKEQLDFIPDGKLACNMLARDGPRNAHPVGSVTFDDEEARTNRKRQKAGMRWPALYRAGPFNLMKIGPLREWAYIY
jgi:hypothetical protein